MSAKIRFWIFGGAGAPGRATAKAAQELGSVHLAAAVPADLGIVVPTTVPTTGDAVTHVVVADAEYETLRDE